MPTTQTTNAPTDIDEGPYAHEVMICAEMLRLNVGEMWTALEPLFLAKWDLQKRTLRRSADVDEKLMEMDA